MLDLPRAMQVTVNCVRVTANLFPPGSFPIKPQDPLLRLGIDNTRIDLLRANIGGSPQFGLPSLMPPRKIDTGVLDIDETSTVSDVFVLVSQNTVLA
jgi:hypothetical protein